MNETILVNTISVLNDELSKKTLELALAQAELAVLKEEQHDAKTNNEG